MYDNISSSYRTKARFFLGHPIPEHFQSLTIIRNIENCGVRIVTHFRSQRQSRHSQGRYRFAGQFDTEGVQEKFIQNRKWVEPRHRHMLA